MKLILFGFSEPPLSKVAYEITRSFSLDYFEYYSNGVNSEKTPLFDLPNTCQEICHLVDNLHNAKYDVENLDPIDELLLESMAHCETQVLRMFDRLNLWEPLSYERRKNLYLKHLRYWNHVLRNRGIDICIFSGVPHAEFDYIAYELCKYHKVPVIIFSCPSLVLNTSFISNDWENPAPDLHEKYQVLKGLIDNSKNISLTEKYDLFFNNQSNLKNNPTPYYMSKDLLKSIEILQPKISFSLSNISLFVKKIYAVAQGKSIEDMFLRILQKRCQARENQSVRQLYVDNAILPDYKNLYLYFPLQLQPECTTSPMAGCYVDQLLIAQMLSALVPSNTLIYIKEHPAQASYGSVGRSAFFYEELLKLKNVRLITESAETFDLIDNCVGIVSATGTAGWEGVLRGKPFLMFGHHIYQYSPAVFPIKTVDDCKNALTKIFDNSFVVNQDEIRLFLKAFEETAINGDTVPYRMAVSALSIDENIKSISTALIDKIRQIIARNPLLT